MLSVVTAALALFLLLTQQALPQPTPSVDPATSQFLADTGLLLVAVKPTAVADYEAAIRLLQEAMAKTEDPQRQAVARGWKVYKAQEVDAKGNTLYVHLLLPVVATFDYRASLLIEEMVATLPPDLLSKYRDAFAVPPTKLNLDQFANMATVPVAPSTNTSPNTVAPPKKPGR
jgi:hypothetical protein